MKKVNLAESSVLLFLYVVVDAPDERVRVPRAALQLEAGQVDRIRDRGYIK